MPDWLLAISKLLPWLPKIASKRLLVASIAIVVGSLGCYLLLSEPSAGPFKIGWKQSLFSVVGLTLSVLCVAYGVVLFAHRILPHSNATTRALRTASEGVAILAFSVPCLILVLKFDQTDGVLKGASISFAIGLSCAMLAAGTLLRKTSYTSHDGRSEAWGLMFESAQREIQIIGGDLSWLSTHQDKLLERLKDGKRVRLVMPAKYVSSQGELAQRLSALIVAGADIRTTSESASCAARLIIKDPGSDASLLVLEPNRDASRKELTRYDMPRNSLFIDTAQSLFRSLVDLATPAVVLQATREIIDTQWMLSRLRGEIPHYGELKDTSIRTQYLKPSQLFTCCKYAKAWKLEWAKGIVSAYHASGTPLFEPRCMTSTRDGRVTKRTMLPPIVERRIDYDSAGRPKSESYVVLDGLHRILAAHMRDPDRAVQCVVIEGCSKPLPARRTWPLLYIGQISERVAREKMFEGYSESNFRNFKQLDLSLVITSS